MATKKRKKGPRKPTKKTAPNVHEERYSGWVWGVAAFALAIGGTFFLTYGFGDDEELGQSDDVDHQSFAAPVVPKSRGLKVLRSFSHEVDAFTQGLLVSGGKIYESTGQYGASSIRVLDRQSGKVLERRDIDERLFAEGMTLVGDELFVLTWQSGVMLVFDKHTLREKRRLSYEGEGWGLCTMGDELVMSDGSSTLKFRHPTTFKVTRELNVKRAGKAQRSINELECVGDTIYANIWQRDEIIAIDRESGAIKEVIDASGLLTKNEASRANVLNGIAYDDENKNFLLTGKYWPRMFEVVFD